MARKKLSEFKAKTLLFKYLQLPYGGLQVTNSKEDLEKVEKLDKTKSYVVKVDQGVKGRMKKGLVGVNVSPYKIKSYIREFAVNGYTQFLIEDFIVHEGVDEKYFALDRTREGIAIFYSPKGGIDIESHQELVKKEIISEKNRTQIASILNLSLDTFNKLLNVFDDLYISFLEVNPFVIKDENFYFLDLAVEVDSAGEFFVKNAWASSDFVEGPKNTVTEEEKNIQRLQSKSQASLKLEVLNPNGSLFVMYFGGGGSIVIADEIYNLGFGKELANFGDYSGGPNLDETYVYVKNLLSLLLKSKAPKKVLLIAGGVANFTDVRVTFKGAIQALSEVTQQLEEQGIKIFVRRPGPNQTEGLAMISKFLQENNLFGGVWDQTMVLSDVVTHAIGGVK